MPLKNNFNTLGKLLGAERNLPGVFAGAKGGHRQARNKHLDQFQDKGVSIWFWIQRIAKNKALDTHRARGRSGKALASYEGLLAPLRQNPEEPGSALEMRQEDERLRHRVQDILGKLNPRYRRVLELRFLEDHPRQECAEAMDVKLGTLTDAGGP